MARGRPRKDKNPAATTSAGNGANPGFEARLWATADALRNDMDAAEYTHVVLGLIFLKYISDAFEARHAAQEAQRAHGTTWRLAKMNLAIREMAISGDAYAP